MQKTCKRCNKTFDDTSKRHRLNYCGRECKSAALADAARLAVHDKNPRTPNVKCPICDKMFYREPWQMSADRTSVCSRKCMGELKAQQMKGNKFGAGLKQTLERIAHRARFIMGDKNPAWRGGVTFKKGRGKKPYRYVKCPAEFSGMAKQQGYIAEHRLVMARHLGRLLLASEVVHHINHDTLDNRIENLQLFSNNSEHKLHEGKSGYFKSHNHTNRRKSL